MDLEQALQGPRSENARWGFKDPRTTFTLRAWLTVLDEAVLIGVYRNSHAIARSLQSRDGFSEDTARAIALAYTTRLADLHRSLGFPILEFGDDRETLAKGLEDIVTSLGLAWSHAAVDAFLDEGLIHERDSEADGDDDRYLHAASAEASQPAMPATRDDIERALGSAEQRPFNIGLAEGPAHSGRRLHAWRRGLQLRTEVGKLVELEIGRTAGPLPGASIDLTTTIVEHNHTAALAKLAGMRAASHVIGADFLDVIPPQSLPNLLEALTAATDPDAVVALSGLLLDGGAIPSDLYVTGADRTYHRERVPYLHHRDTLEAALLASPWHLAGIESDAGLTQRSYVYLARSPVRRRPGHLSAAEIRHEKRNLDEQVADLAQKLASVKAEGIRVTQELQDSRRTLSDARRSLSDAHRQLEETRRHLEETNLKREHLQAAVERRDADIRTKVEQLTGSEKKQQDLQEDVRSLQLRYRSLAQRHQSLETRYNRLAKRRSVRMALAFARFGRPLFRLIRRLRHRTPVNPPPHIETGQRTPPVVAETDRSSPADAPQPEAVAMTIDSAPSRIVPRDVLPVTVIIPVFNAFEDLRRCLRSMVRNTLYPARLLLIDDASTDPRIWPYLCDFAATHSNVTALQNPENRGFVATMNRGFAETEGDLVILNSDVEVVPGWLRRLAALAQARPEVATITPLSNNAGAFSAPTAGQAASLPLTMTSDEIGRLVTRTSARTYPSGPTGSGYCMYIRRSALDQVGPFDEEAFPRGYGEENDFCMKALRLGWKHLVDDSTYLFHSRSASFGDDKTDLMANARITIDDRYPDYGSLVKDWISSQGMEIARQSVAEALSGAGSSTGVAPRILYVIHKSGGGTPATNLDLMRALSNRFEPLVLQSDSSELSLLRLQDGALVTTQSWTLDRPVLPTDASRSDYKAIVDEIITEWDIDLVHIRHLLAHTFDLPEVARAHGIPVTLSIHDYYYICPTVHLLDDQDRYCGGVCTPGQGDCRLPTPWLANNLPHLKHGWVKEWQRRVSEMLRSVDAVVVASEAARQVYAGVFEDFDTSLATVIPHGRDLRQQRLPVALSTTEDQPVRILVPGNLAVHKGADLIREIKALDSAGRLEFHFMGKIPEQYQDLGIVHPPYEREAFAQRVSDIAPSFIGVFSRTAETFSHILNESWSLGIPVIVTDRGAPAERIRRRGGGWIVDPDDPVSAHQQIMQAIGNQAEYAKTLEQATLAGERSVAEMASDYEALYRKLMLSKRAFADGDEHPIRAGLFLAGSAGEHPGSAHVRVLRRFFHPSVSHRVVPILLDPKRFVEYPDLVDIDVALVQRNAVSPELSDPLRSLLLKEQLPLIFEIDDSLLDMPDDHPDREAFAPWQGVLGDLAEAADAVTVSTPPLADHLRAYSSNVHLLPNMLDERLWFGGPIGDPPVEDGIIRVLYYGTSSHRHDLEMMQPVFESLAEDIPIELWVAGVQRQPSWHRHLDIPIGASSYPVFVEWLRSVASRFHIAIAPLVDNPFNRTKSDLKFLEMAALRLPVVCSAIEPFLHTVDHDKTGLLVPNTVPDWVAALRRLASDAALRERLADSAFEYVTTSRALGSTTEDLMALLSTLTSPTMTPTPSPTE